MATNTGRFWDVTRLAEHLGVPKGWIYDRTRQDGPEVIPHLKFGKYVRFDPCQPLFSCRRVIGTGKELADNNDARELMLWW